MHKRTLAIDYGEKRIGLAISDEYGKFALPYEAIENKNLKCVADEIEKIIAKEGISKIVVGLPKSLKGGEVRNKSLDKFIKNLSCIKVSVGQEQNHTCPHYQNQSEVSAIPIDNGDLDRLVGLEIILFDERMSSKAADKFKMHGDKRKSGWRDKVAAAIILQDYLDTLNYKIVSPFSNVD